MIGNFKRFFLFFFFLLLACSGEKGYTFEKPSIKIVNELKNEYLGLFFQDKKIGYFHGSAYEALLENKKIFYLYGNALIRLKLENDVVNTILNEEIIIDGESKKTLYFNYRQQIGDSDLRIIGSLQGKQIVLRIETGGSVQTLEIEDYYMPLASAGFLLWQDGIKEGKKKEYKVFVEALQKKEDIIMEIGTPKFIEGKKVYPLKQRLGNIEIESEILENGDIFKEESIHGFTMKKLSKEEAIKFDGELSLYDLFSYSLVPVDKPIIGEVKELKLALKGAGNFKIPESSYQKVEIKDGIHLISLTTKGSEKILKEDINIEKYLRETPKIQKNNKKIKDLAEDITRGIKDNSEKAKAIVTWVNKNIKKRLRDRSSALEVLITKEGECEAHAMLTTALLRSIGIPTRIVGGIAYSRENKGFLYHAWNEVYIDGVFFPVDATFGQFPADATHLKLTDEDNMEDVAMLIGKIKIEILKVN
ncbi:MAG: transglutaminase-like domain-containing protein [Proteobacteria bacterium]|nr:transglutaminase-like domain-containing protein [Pseudomonadota bacterium]